MKLRKLIAACSIMSLCAVVAGCGNNANEAGNRSANQGNNVSDVLEAGLNDETTEATTEAAAVVAPVADNKATTEPTTTEAVTEELVEETDDTDTATELETVVEAPEYDVDLTQLSSTMVYSEVYNMTTAPDDYLGKKVKMSGPFSVYTDESTGKNYFACIIQDAAACCAQGIEFELEGNYIYPDNYPAVGTEVTVSGTFDVYEEDGYTYCTLRNAMFE
ncbi:MAG: hypothetical protein IJ763_10615 [Lachnospiraceae bacterium]|nr:hypothetical protein [Lachnospiraceae bacterium]MBR1817129.1 hypothetical protein [Lachnospiraceae bacterium]